jgi:hypothetical protein
MAPTPLRARSLSILESKGFKVAGNLPWIKESEVVRPTVEIASRFIALDCLYDWVAATESSISTAELNELKAENQVVEWLTADENQILSLPRMEARDRHLSTIGWKLENMWPLAWVLGFAPEPDVDGGMIKPDVIQKLWDFILDVDISVAKLCKRATVRSDAAIIELEDVFYCAHNAVRSAQGGRKTVPAHFDPIVDGGTVHERRHALTWCLSPEVCWDDTDLST